MLWQYYVKKNKNQLIYFLRMAQTAYSETATISSGVNNVFIGRHSAFPIRHLVDNFIYAFKVDAVISFGTSETHFPIYAMTGGTAALHRVVLPSGFKLRPLLFSPVYKKGLKKVAVKKTALVGNFILRMLAFV
jgi:hypothetical protein